MLLKIKLATLVEPEREVCIRSYVSSILNLNLLKPSAQIILNYLHLSKIIFDTFFSFK
jgi:uncharacterized ion transporter superfamily protein YfcC